MELHPWVIDPSPMEVTLEPLLNIFIMDPTSARFIAFTYDFTNWAAVTEGLVGACSFEEIPRVGTRSKAANTMDTLDMVQIPPSCELASTSCVALGSRPGLPWRSRRGSSGRAPPAENAPRRWENNPKIPLFRLDFLHSPTRLRRPPPQSPVPSPDGGVAVRAPFTPPDAVR